MKYFQTWNKLTKLRKIPIIGNILYRAVQSMCGVVIGHEISKTEWGYGGGNSVDVWCRWCNKMMSIPKDEAHFRFPRFRHLHRVIKK